LRWQIDKYTAWIIALSASALVLGVIRVLTWETKSAAPPPAAIEQPGGARPKPPAAVAVEPTVYAEEQEIRAASDVVGKLLGEYRIRPSLIRDRGVSTVATVPRDFHFIEFYAELRERLDDVDGAVTAVKEERAKNRIDFDVLVDDKQARHFTFLRRSGLTGVCGKAAIIIDDFGYSYNDLVQEFLTCNQPLTISIIPGLEETKRVARDAELNNRKILIHMPMEPEGEKFSADGYTILAGQNPGTVRLRVRSAFAEIPAAVGMNNHQGSKATADKKTMRAVLEEIKRQKKIFVDSRTSSQSVAVDIARSLRVPIAVNQVFIDAKDDEDFIRGQLNKMADLAVQQGHVVAIAHMRKSTWRVLRETMPQLSNRGIEFVYITDLF
jgi:polysaccharide deacetylase 2 family uncharacterized protein YibQ